MKKKSGFHWGLLCSALLYMLVGFFLLKWPDRAIQIVCYAFGTITLVYGMTRLIRYALKKNQEQGILSGLNLTIGIIMTGIGSFLLVSPSTVVSIIPIVIGIVIVIHSLTKIQQALEIKAVQYDKWWIMLIVSLVTAVLGIIIVFKPFSTAALMVKVIGIILIADGQIAADMKPDELLCTDLLVRNGIREPLYISALRHAGCSLQSETHPQHIESMDLTAYSEKVKDWFDQVKLPVRKPDAAPELEVKGLSYSYIPGIPVLEDINFTIHKGEMISIVGKNGAGKSTLSSLICGFMKPDLTMRRSMAPPIFPQPITASFIFCCSFLFPLAELNPFLNFSV